MAAPVALETWNITHLPTGVNQTRKLMFDIKTALITGLGAWSVVRSCGKVGGITWTAGAADYWDVEAAIEQTAGASNHSWIVLKQTGMGGAGANFQICLDWNSDTGSYFRHINVVISYSAGFTGGSLTARPTATDEYSHGSTYALCDFCVGNTAGAYVCKTTSGKCTRVFTSVASGTYKGVWIFEEPKNQPSWWDKPYLALVMGGTASGSYLFNYANFNTAASFGIESGAVDLAAYITSEGAVTPLGTLAQFGTADYNNEWICLPAGILASQANIRGWMGEVRDLWWVSDDLPDGTYMPSDGSKQFVVIGDILQPWDGTAIVFD